jgi:hypothetical protein
LSILDTAPSTDHAGNLKFRELVKQRREEYVNVQRRKEKQKIAGEIVAAVMNHGGRFLERMENSRSFDQSGKVTKSYIWEPVTDKKTLLVKVKQAMRDVGPDAQEKRLRRRELRRRGIPYESPTKTDKGKAATAQTINPLAFTNQQLSLTIPGSFQVNPQMQAMPPVVQPFPSLSRTQDLITTEQAYLLRLRLAREALLRQQSLFHEPRLYEGFPPLGEGIVSGIQQTSFEQRLQSTQEQSTLQQEQGQLRRLAQLQLHLQQSPSSHNLNMFPTSLLLGNPSHSNLRQQLQSEAQRQSGTTHHPTIGLGQPSWLPPDSSTSNLSTLLQGNRFSAPTSEKQRHDKKED